MADSAKASLIRRIALIGNCPPRLCGIATFTADVRAALTAAYPQMAVDVYAMNDIEGRYEYGPEVVCAIAQDCIADYHLAARQINESGADVVLVQHEYGIFGGDAGALLLKLLDRVVAPVVVTLHTVLEQPDPGQRLVIEALARRSARLIVMAEKGREILRRTHGIQPERVAVVPHGVPDRPLRDTAELKAPFGFSGRQVLLTFGLLSPNKGIETMIRAMPTIASAHPDALYVILGATHPHLVAREGETYREQLAALADEIGVTSHVRFVDGFLDQEHLLDYLESADIYVTPYLNAAQITSGTLSYAIGLGKPVVSTPYWHAQEILADGVGLLPEFGDVEGFARAIVGLLDDPAHMEAMRCRAWEIGRGMLWSRLAEAYVDICAATLVARPVRLAHGNRHSRAAMPPRLGAIERLTDNCGMLQHSIFDVPDRDHGYCVDDNCRALMLMHRFSGVDAARADQLALIYASFVQYAWNARIGRFRNFMSYERAWLEEEGSQDSFGRCLWSLGVTAAEARQQGLRRWALHLFDQVAPNVRALAYPRSWAFAMLGAEALLSAHPGHAVARSIIGDFGERLQKCLRGSRRQGWTWFEPWLSYDNARLAEALIRAGQRLDDRAKIDDGLAALAWLDKVQSSETGLFRAVGTDGFGREMTPPSPFDQQPLEAWATIDAAEAAHLETGEGRWAEMAWRAYRWYLGDNDLGTPIASLADGGCYDGLMRDRVNFNQGAESVLAFQFACCAMARMEQAGSGVLPRRINGAARAG